VDELMTKSKILKLIQSEREALESVLAGLSEEQMTQPGVENNWSVKDIMAHITDWERRMVGWIVESLRGEVPQRPAPGMNWDNLDRLNQQTYMLNRDRELGDVLAEFQRSYEGALRTVEALTEDDLIDPQRFEWRGGDPMWHMVAANTWEHYEEHRESMDRWLQEEGLSHLY
jgi:hypothetical protein